MNLVLIVQFYKADHSVYTDRQTDIARMTGLVILIKNLYTLKSQKPFLLPVTYFSKSLVYPFTPRLTGIIKSNFAMA